MVKPGGTGSPRLAISARLAPLPPNRSRRPALPSALPSPKVKTHLSDFGAAETAGLGACFATGFVKGLVVRGLAVKGLAVKGLAVKGLAVKGLAATFFSGFRAVAAAAGFTRAGADAFDFAAIFFGLATALAMTWLIRERWGKFRALHHFGRAGAR